MKTNGNDLVSPLSTEELSDRFSEGITLQAGLTKREWFAGLAMQGVLTSLPPGVVAINSETIAKESVIMANKLIRVLNKFD